MKVLAGSFQCEANTFVPFRAVTQDFEVHEGKRALEKLAAVKVFRENRIEVEPLIFASALPSGMVERETFEHFKNIFCGIAEKHRDADGIYLYLHGSMYVEGLGSGEEALLCALRKTVGETVPISVALDFHASLSDGFLQYVNAVNGFRTAPHRDHDDTEYRAARSLIHCMETKTLPRPSVVRMPGMGADAVTTDQEPFITITEELRRLDGRDDIISAALFHGQLWYDVEYNGVAAVVSAEEERMADEAALRLAGMFWAGRKQLCLKGALPVDEAVEQSLKSREGLLFLTDSGDNTTAGASGEGTLLLKKYLERRAEGVLVCGIADEETTKALLGLPEGERATVTLCKGRHEKQEQEITFDAVVRQKGVVCGWAGDEIGKGVLLSCGGVDIVLTEARAAFTTPRHFEKMGIDPYQYKVIVLKLGYLFPQLLEISGQTIFALTPGQSTNDVNALDFRHVKKNMYPMSDRITWGEIAEQIER